MDIFFFVFSPLNILNTSLSFTFLFHLFFGSHEKIFTGLETKKSQTLVTPSGRMKKDTCTESYAGWADKAVCRLCYWSTNKNLWNKNVRMILKDV